MPSSINFSSLTSNPATYKVLLLVLLAVVGGILFVELAPDASAHAGHTCLNESCSVAGSCDIHLAEPTLGCPTACCSIGPALCIADEVKARQYDCSTAGGSCTATGAIVDDSCTSWEAEGKDPNDCAECAVAVGSCTKTGDTCTDGPGSSYRDICREGFLDKYTCVGGSCTLTKDVSCPVGTSCKGGDNSCTPTAALTCNDTDGDNYIDDFSVANFAERGTCTDSGGFEGTDFCTPVGISEYFCSTSGVCSQGGTSCPLGTTCSAGACIISNGGPGDTGGGTAGTVSFENPLETDLLKDLLDRVLDILIIFGGSLYVLMILIAAFIYTTSGANPQKRATAKNILIFSTIGFFILITGRVIFIVITSLVL